MGSQETTEAGLAGDRVLTHDGEPGGCRGREVRQGMGQGGQGIESPLPIGSQVLQSQEAGGRVPTCNGELGSCRGRS